MRLATFVIRSASLSWGGSTPQLMGRAVRQQARMTRPSPLASIVVLAAVAFSYGCKSPPVDWEAFARRSYVDLDMGDGGRDKWGWLIAFGQRAPESMVASVDGSLSQSDWRTVVDTLTARTASARLLDAVVPDSAIVWTTPFDGRAVLLSMSIPSEGAPLADVWSEAADRLVRVPALSDRLNAVLWVEGGQVTIVRLVEAAREDYEVPDNDSWWLQDVIDLDGDDAPDLVLVRRGYESTSVAIVSVVEHQLVERWEGLGREL